MKLEGYGYSDAWKAIIRPPRDEYTDKELGSSKFMIKHKTFQRSDFDLRNDRNLVLKCSFFEPIKRERPLKELPCIIYLHGNCSSRLEAIPYIATFLSANITFFCFDFSGSGKSEGEYISLGWWEREDLKTVVEYLRKSKRTSTIGLWGRSMGAVTALLHADSDHSIAGLVLDSPFASLTRLTEELCKKYAKGVPGFLFSIAQWFVKNSVKSRANFSIDDLKPVDHVKNAYIPALFIVAKDDDFIDPKHGVELYEAYSGDKNLIWVEGSHNSARQQHTLTSIFIFFYNTLQIEKLIPESVRNSDKPLVKNSKHEIIHPKPTSIKPQIIMPKQSVVISEEISHYMVPQLPSNPIKEEDELIRTAIELSLETAAEEEKVRKKEKRPKTQLDPEGTFKAIKPGGDNDPVDSSKSVII